MQTNATRMSTLFGLSKVPDNSFLKNVDDKIFNSNLLLHECIYEQNVQSTGGQSRVKMQVYEEKKCAPTRKNVRTGAAAPSSVSLQISH